MQRPHTHSLLMFAWANGSSGAARGPSKTLCRRPGVSLPTRRSLVVLGLASLLASASFRCGSGHRTSDGGGADRVSPGNVSSQGEQANGTCPTQPRKLLGTSAAQSSCGTFAECAPSCCGCPSGLDSWLAAACIDGRCADRATVCATTLSATWCSSYLPGDGGPEASPADEGTFPSREAGSSAGCVEGDYYSCSGTGEHWTGKLCCVTSG